MVIMSTHVNIKNDYSYISPSHIRAGRAWLGWTLDIAVEKLSIPRKTLWRYEASQSRISKSSAAKIYSGFMNNGVELRKDGLRVV
jgi:hypothetical protein